MFTYSGRKWVHFSLPAGCGLPFVSLFGVCGAISRSNQTGTPHTIFFLLHTDVEVWRKKMKFWLFHSFLLLLKCAFTVVISYGVVISGCLLNYDSMWRVPAKWTHELLFFFFFLKKILSVPVHSDLWAVVFQRCSSVISPSPQTTHIQSLKHADMKHTTMLFMLTPSQDYVNSRHTHTETHKSYLLLFFFLTWFYSLLNCLMEAFAPL